MNCSESPPAGIVLAVASTCGRALRTPVIRRHNPKGIESSRFIRQAARIFADLPFSFALICVSPVRKITVEFCPLDVRLRPREKRAMSNYKSYRDLPPLAGICPLTEAIKPGLSVEECVRRLKRYHYSFKRLHQIYTARITAEPIYELKMGFSLHAHLAAEQATALRKRVGEMREPPLGLESVPDANLEILFDEILGAPTTEELVLGLYQKALPALKSALERHLADTNLLADHPSVRVCRFALLEVEDMLRFGAQCIAGLIDAPVRQGTESWLA